MSMDRKIEDKRWIIIKYWRYIVGTILLLSVFAFVILQDHESTFRIEKEKVSISTVTEGSFQDYINVIGEVEPISNVYLEVLENGRVQQRFFEQGDMVKKGDVIFTLTNDELNMDFLNEDNSFRYLTNELKNKLLQIEGNVINSKRDLLILRNEVFETKRLYEKNADIHKKGGVSDENLLSSKNNYEVAVAKQELMIAQLRIDSLMHENEKSQITIEIERIRQRLNNLKVKATTDGQLSMDDIELGQSILKGTKIGQISVLSSYKIEAKIDEHYIDRIIKGLQATLVRQTDTFYLEIIKVNPEVIDGTFDVDLRFVGEMPQNIRLGQTYNIALQLGETQSALLLARGGFFQSTGGQWVYVLDEGGQSASKREIRIGKQNPQYYEVMDGLYESESVITSSYELFGDNDKLIFK